MLPNDETIRRCDQAPNSDSVFYPLLRTYLKPDGRLLDIAALANFVEDFVQTGLRVVMAVMFSEK